MSYATAASYKGSTTPSGDGFVTVQATVRMTGLQPFNMRRATNRKQPRHAVLLTNGLYSLAPVTLSGRRT
jgi:hypothetical protein